MSDDQDDTVAKVITWMWEISERKTETCIYCGKHINHMEKIGRCVYARPCGDRLWQGRIPEAWKQ